MIALGTYDPSTPPEALAQYRARVRTLTGATALSEWSTQLRDEGRWVDYTPLPAGEAMSVVALQRFLRDAGFLPFAKDDGICGYRTSAAIFLFQEYVRTVEGLAADIGLPDGKAGRKTFTHVQRWQSSGLRAEWADFSASHPTPEHARMVQLLAAFKVQCLAHPGPVFSSINAAGPSDTLKVADWDFDAARIHLVGVRRRKSEGTTGSGGDPGLDDPFMLLIRGMVFTFYGSTEPGTKVDEEPRYPLLVPGQHRYRLGWHKQTVGAKIYQALKPAGRGVWVQRLAAKIATDAELQGPLDPRLNASINVHWGGNGMRDSASWSSGCQVIVGKRYSNHRAEVVDCRDFAAVNYDELGRNGKSKGAYTVLESLIAALSGEDPDDNVIRYTLLTEADLALDGDRLASQTVAMLEQLRTA